MEPPWLNCHNCPWVAPDWSKQKFIAPESHFHSSPIMAIKHFQQYWQLWRRQPLPASTLLSLDSISTLFSSNTRQVRWLCLELWISYILFSIFLLVILFYFVFICWSCFLLFLFSLFFIVWSYFLLSGFLFSWFLFSWFLFSSLSDLFSTFWFSTFLLVICLILFSTFLVLLVLTLGLATIRGSMLTSCSCSVD